MNRVLTILALTVAGLALIACSESAPDGSTSAQADSGWILAAAPSNPLTVANAKQSVAEGEKIVITGRIGGRVDPISSNSPVFVITDISLPYCGQACEGGCPTPWDYCCESPETLAKNTATIQLVDDSGAPLSVDPVAGGLEPLDEIIVVGTVAPRPDQSVLTILATGVFTVSDD